MNLWLVRHGATDWSDAGRFNGRTDVPLNERGRRQAGALRGELGRGSFAGLWSSDSARAIETATLAVGAAAVDDRLAELDFGTLEGKTWSECTPEVQQELVDFDRFAAPEGESVAALRGRVHAFLADLPEGDHVLFTHGGVIRLLLRATSGDRRVAPGQLVRIAGGIPRGR